MIRPLLIGAALALGAFLLGAVAGLSVSDAGYERLMATLRIRGWELR